MGVIIGKYLKKVWRLSESLAAGPARVSAVFAAAGIWGSSQPRKVAAAGVLSAL